MPVRVHACLYAHMHIRNHTDHLLVFFMAITAPGRRVRCFPAAFRTGVRVFVGAAGRVVFRCFGRRGCGRGRRLTRQAHFLRLVCCCRARRCQGNLPRRGRDVGAGGFPRRVRLWRVWVVAVDCAVLGCSSDPSLRAFLLPPWLCFPQRALRLPRSSLCHTCTNAE